MTDDYRGNPGDKITHLKLHGLYNLRVGGNFLDERTDEYTTPSSRATGIDAYDAAFSIRPNFSSCSFENLYEGIHISKVNETTGSCHIEGAEFEKCFTGIYSNNHNNFYFGGNTFYLFRPDNFTGEAPETLTGILLDGMADGFMLTQNDFSSALADNDDRPIGCDVVAISTANNRIFKNNFEYLYYGNRAGGINAMENSLGGQVATYSGLWYECNVNTENILDPEFFSKKDFYVQSYGKIRYVQGRVDQFNNKIATGNIFTDPTSSFGTFYNLGAEVIYLYYVSDPLQDPYFPTGLDLQSANENTDCGDEECPPPCDTEIELASRKTQFFQTREDWADRLEALPAISSNPQKLRASADTVNYLRAELDREGGLILCHYTLDSTQRRVDSILTWLGYMQTYESDLRLALHGFFSGDFTGSAALVADLSSRYELGEAREAELDEVKAVLEIVQNALEEETPLDKLPQELLDTLEINWGTGCSEAGALARNILHRNGRNMRADCSEAARPLSQNTTWLLTGKLYHVYPNPASTEIRVEGPIIAGTTLFVTDISGRIVMAQQIADTSLPIVLDVSRLQDGLYVLSMNNMQGKTEHDRFLILR
ncbi:MAG TPA: T9SS type A sorting domain-containing protein [Saprospiraceae bacterium]|nr:T9SS type A sorting domain-containing protein [Saprospiraceae bacterium]